MINLIIFSKDRAMQLDALLSSVAENCNIFDKITVIWKGSGFSFKLGYGLLKHEYPEANFIEESDFKKNVIHALDCEHTCYMVDDLIAYRKIECMPEIQENNVCFSLRLARNRVDSFTDIQYKDYVGFNWTGERAYFNYPFSLDGHIFNTEYIKPMIKDREYNNPNKLEIAFGRYKATAPNLMSCFRESIVVSIPINRVSDTASASFGEKYPHTAKELNDMFLRNQRIDWRNMDFENIKRPHQEIEFKFKQK